MSLVLEHVYFFGPFPHALQRFEAAVFFTDLALCLRQVSKICTFTSLGMKSRVVSLLKIILMTGSYLCFSNRALRYPLLICLRF